MHRSAPDDAHPFVDTSIARLMRSRLSITHEECGISVISGPWGVGKTWAIQDFAQRYPFNCAVIKVEPSTPKKGASPVFILQQAITAISAKLGHGEPSTHGTYWILRRTLSNLLENWRREKFIADDDVPFNFSFIFDEAQYLSREAIEMLRFWNDGDTVTVPFPIGLAFVGNNEFALQEDATGHSVLSGAVRSRLLFQEPLQYANVGDLDLTIFLQSRGITDGGAIAEFLAYFASSGRPRDLRNVERQAAFFKRRASDDPVTADVVRSILAVGRP